MSDPFEQERLVEAAAWRARLADSQGACMPDLRSWLERDSANAEAWQCVQGPWELLGEHAASPGLIRLRRIALAHAHDAARSHLTRHRGIRSPAGLAAAIVLVIVGIGLTLGWQTSRFDTYRTRAGERRVITLNDGSQMDLDSQSEVRVRYGAHSRELALIRGQARFDVAHDVTRPFTVTAGGETVVATGTAFNVDLLGPDLLVTLIEGHVVVLPEKERTFAPSITGGAAAPPAAGTAEPETTRINLDAGDQLVVSPQKAPRVARVSVDRTTAWERGELVFDNEPLTSVVARVSRYGSHPIVIADDQTSTMKISGVFHEGDVAGFVSTIVSYLPLSAHERADGSVQLSAR